MAPGINIFSGSDDPLGAALTNPTELARKKGKLAHGFPVVFQNHEWPDIELAYAKLAGPDEMDNDQLMVELIAAKLTQYPALVAEVEERGGLAFLETCQHATGARTAGFQAWEGVGAASRFIRNLLAAYAAVSQGQVSARGQFQLF